MAGVPIFFGNFDPIFHHFFVSKIKTNLIFLKSSPGFAPGVRALVKTIKV